MTIKYSAEAPNAEQLAKQLRSSANGMDKASFRSWKFWIGFLWGAIFMATLNVGDVHICVGECDGEGFSLIGRNP